MACVLQRLQLRARWKVRAVLVLGRKIVLEQGAIIADGPLDEVVRDERVLRTYLGSAAPEGA